jgi:hypothetical protein
MEMDKSLATISTTFDSIFLTWGKTDNIGTSGLPLLAFFALLQHFLDLINSELANARLPYGPSTIVLVRVVRRYPGFCVQISGNLKAAWWAGRDVST